MVSEITRFNCKPDMMSLPRGVSRDFSWRNLKEWPRLHDSNFLAAMHGFRDDEGLLSNGYDVIVSPPPGRAAQTFYDRLSKSDHDFMIAFHSNFLSAIHGFQDNEVLLQSRYDGIISPPLGGFHTIFARNMKERPQFHNDGSSTYFAYFLPLRSFLTFYFGW